MIKDVLILQKRELAKKLEDPYCEREISSKKFENSMIKVIIGPRRAGKSFFAMHALAHLGTFGYVNFDDEKLVNVKDYDEIVDTVKSLYQNPKHLLFDEIQNLPRWELFVNRMQRQNYNMIITGSNANLLSKELATHLTGRHMLIVLFPFSFREIIAFEKKELTSNEIRERLYTYISQGGYPEPALSHIDSKEYISLLFNAILYKDIIKRFNIRFVAGIEDLALYLISNIAKEFSYGTLSRVTKCKSHHTIEKYISYLEEAFLFFELQKFSFKIKEQISSNKKIYCFDNGLINAKAFKVSQDLGRIYENTVAIELKRMAMEQNISVYYWKSPSGEEVDFAIKEGTKVKELIQVCYDATNQKTRQREVSALLKAGRELKCKNLTLITDNKEGAKKESWFGMKEIVHEVPLWKWLLAKRTDDKDNYAISFKKKK